jgi:hypothetical protein
MTTGGDQRSGTLRRGLSKDGRVEARSIRGIARVEKCRSETVISWDIMGRRR